MTRILKKTLLEKYFDEIIEDSYKYFEKKMEGGK